MAIIKLIKDNFKALKEASPYLLGALIFWVAFFWFGHWAIVRPPLNWLVFVYTHILLIFYTINMIKEIRIHSRLKIKPFVRFIFSCVLVAPWFIFFWTLIEIVERL
jgi:hypothetical protein